jgi:hypothetical protein
MAGAVGITLELPLGLLDDEPAEVSSSRPVRQPQLHSETQNSPYNGPELASDHRTRHAGFLIEAKGDLVLVV